MNQQALHMLQTIGLIFQGRDVGDFANEMVVGDGGHKNLVLSVPRPAVGVIIGKGGDMIKKIQGETGACVQFLQDDGQSVDRTCSISGPPDKVQEAAGMIKDLINSAIAKDVCFTNIKLQ